MRLEIKVFPKSKEEKIVIDHGMTKVYVKAVPDKGKANKEVIKLLAKKYKVKKSEVSIIRGLTVRNKLIEIKD